MDEFISLAVIEMTKYGPLGNPELATQIFKAHNVDFEQGKIMSVLIGTDHVNMKVIHSDLASQANFVILLVDVKIISKILSKVLEFANKFLNNPRKLRFILTNCKLNSKKRDPQRIIEFMLNYGSPSYHICPSDIYLDFEYRRLLSDIVQK